MTTGYSSEIFIRQFPIVRAFVYHLTYYRCLNKGYDKCGFDSEFWTHTIDAHLLQASINWCKVFGSDRQNDIHWVKLNNNKHGELNLKFLLGLKTSCGIDLEEWKSYRKVIINFRNKFVAHTDLLFAAPVPSFDMALQVAFYYDIWIREIISPDYLAEGSLTLFSENLIRKMEIPLALVITNSKTVLDGIE